MISEVVRDFSEPEVAPLDGSIEELDDPAAQLPDPGVVISEFAAENGKNTAYAAEAVDPLSDGETTEVQPVSVRIVDYGMQSGENGGVKPPDAAEAQIAEPAASATQTQAGGAIKPLHDSDPVVGNDRVQLVDTPESLADAPTAFTDMKEPLPAQTQGETDHPKEQGPRDEPGAAAKDSAEDDMPPAAGGDAGDNNPPDNGSTETGDDSDGPHPLVIVERKVVDDVPLTAVLAPQLPERVADIAEQLADCDTVVVGGVYYRDEEHRQELKDRATELMSSQADPATVASGERGEHDDYLDRLFASLQGTDKQAEIVGMSVNAPGYFVAERATAAFYTYDRSITELDSPAVARVNALHYVQAAGEAQTMLAEYTNLQLRRVITATQQEAPGRSVGVVLDNGLYDVVNNLGGEQTEPAEPLAQRVEQRASILSKAVQAFRQGDMLRTIQLADQHLISQYAASAILGMEDTATMTYDQIEEVVESRGPAWASETLRNMDSLLMSAQPEQRQSIVGFSLRSVVDEAFERMLGADEPDADGQA